MNLLSIFSFSSDKKQAVPAEVSSHWVKCKSCQALMYFKEVENQKHVCPKCGYHIRIGVKERIELLSDTDTFVEYDDNLRPIDPLKFVDKKSYKVRIEEGYKKTGRYSSVVAGECKMNGVGVQVVIFDFAFMGGSLGSVEGEKIVRAVNRAIANQQGLIILSASGLVGPFAPSAIILTVLKFILFTLSSLITFSIAAGINTSTSCSNQASSFQSTK